MHCSNNIGLFRCHSPLPDELAAALSLTIVLRTRCYHTGGGRVRFSGGFAVGGQFKTGNQSL